MVRRRWSAQNPILLAGAGHAHLHLVRRAEELTASGVEVILVNPGDFFYSGSAAGVLAGLYSPGTNRIDVGALAAAHGVTWLRDRIVGAEPGRRRVRLASGSAVSYGLLSVNVGSVPATEVEGAAEHAVPVKPVEDLLGLVSVVRAHAARGDRLRVVVVGGGASGCEVALALRARAEGEEADVSVTVATDGEILEELTAGARRSMRRELDGKGVELLENARVRRVEGDRVLLDDGRSLPSDVTVNASGLVPMPVVRRLGLPTGPGGGLTVDAGLRSVADERVFGAGDCVGFRERPLAKAGVHAVRQAPVLLRNLRRAAAGNGASTEIFRPRTPYLTILGLGDGRGLAARGRLHWTGRLAWKLKDWLDGRFLSRHREETRPRGGSPAPRRAGPRALGEPARPAVSSRLRGRSTAEPGPKEAPT